MIRALIVDDEIGAIKNLQLILHEQVKSIEVIGYATSSQDAELKIKILKPDVVFLDIEMPAESGIEFLQRLNNYDFEVVFITAYSEHAIKAFKLNAIDYLLKPIDLKELKHCVNRLIEINQLKQNYRETLNTERLALISSKINSDEQSKIVLRTKDKIHLVRFDEIISLSADGAYTLFKCLIKEQPNQILMSYPLAHYMEILPKVHFIRVHKSSIVNISFITDIIKDTKYFILMKYGDKIQISKRRVSEVLNQLKK